MDKKSSIFNLTEKQQFTIVTLVKNFTGWQNLNLIREFERTNTF